MYSKDNQSFIEFVETQINNGSAPSWKGFGEIVGFKPQYMSNVKKGKSKVSKKLKSNTIAAFDLPNNYFNNDSEQVEKLKAKIEQLKEEFILMEIETFKLKDKLLDKLELIEELQRENFKLKDEIRELDK